MCVVALCALLFLPKLHGENLLCYYCPLLPKSKACRRVLAECPPQELCSTASGSFGSRVAIAGRGCMSEQDCHLEHTILYRGNNFTMSYSCCNWHYCNSGSRSSLHLATIALAMAAATILLVGIC